MFSGDKLEITVKYILDSEGHKAIDYSPKFTNDTSYHFLSLSFLF